MPRRPCIRCRRLIDRGSLCDTCRQNRDEQRGVFEPWRELYRTAEWSRAQRECLNRDGGQCRALVGRLERCGETQHLQVHHMPPLRDSWRALHGDWSSFLIVATRVDGLVSLCPRHHSQAERSLRAAR